MHSEKLILNQQRNVTLTAYIQEVGGSFPYIPKRPAIIVIPGGGYQYCSHRESDPVAFAYLQAGYQAFVLHYSVGKDAVWPNPLEDYEQAMELIRSRAEEWGIYPDKIAVVGFSAGGHLAAAAATMSRNRPNAAILGYAVCGEDVKSCNPNAPSAVAAVDRNTCPCFIFATRTDEIVPVENSVDFMRAMIDAGVSFESHIYSYGPHGFSIGDTCVFEPSRLHSRRVPNWVSDSIGWLKEILGDFSDEGMTEPECPRMVSGDYEPTLSVDCTIGHLLKNAQARALLKNLMARGEELDGDGRLMLKMTLRGLLGFAKVPKAAIEALDAQLKQIPNV